VCCCLLLKPQGTPHESRQTSTLLALPRPPACAWLQAQQGFSSPFPLPQTVVQLSGCCCCCCLL
jgi:hypothetical protein